MPRRPAVPPFLKWAGGKQWLAPLLIDLLWGERAYYEPFLGGGAAYFSARPANARLSDKNSELIETYRVVRDRLEELQHELARFKGTAEEYYRVRAEKPRSKTRRAARFIYLNRMCWNGLYRVNRTGQFNTPVGRFEHVPDITCSRRLYAASQALKGVTLRAADFEYALRRARRGSMVFLDPPYTALHSNNGFRRYNGRLFSWEDQKRLARVAGELADRGCYVVICNADHPSIRHLYRTFPYIIRVRRLSLIAGDAQSRRDDAPELLISNVAYDWDGALEDSLSNNANGGR